MKKTLLILLLTVGCYTPLDKVGHLLLPHQRPYMQKIMGIDVEKREYNSTVDSIKYHYFTREAYEVIKNIPMVDGVGSSAWVTGVNFWSNLMGFTLLQGVGRKVIAPRKTIEVHGINVFIHEYVHHLDDMTRDGDGDWIDVEEFKKAYKRMTNDNNFMHIGRGRHVKIYNYPHIVNHIEKKANYWVTDAFGIGELSEHIAYMAGYLVNKGGPEYMWKVYRKVLKH